MAMMPMINVKIFFNLTTYNLFLGAKLPVIWQVNNTLILVFYDAFALFFHHYLVLPIYK